MTQNFPFRVLVVDDELLLRWSIAETLKEHGHTVVEAKNGAGALRELQMSSPPVDAVVLDYQLPDTDNFSLLAQIRRIAPRTPVILMTAFGTREVVEGALELGAYDVMDKPFDMNELEGVVERACKGGIGGEAPHAAGDHGAAGCCRQRDVRIEQHRSKRS